MASEPSAVIPSALLGLLTAAAVAWYACPLPAGRPWSFPQLCAAAAGYLALTALAAALGAALPALLARRRPPPAPLLRTMVAASWLAPFCLFFRQGSDWAIPFGVVCSAAAAWLFLPRGWRPTEAGFPQSLGAAVLVQAGVLAWADSWRLPAVLSLGVVAAFLVVRAAPPRGIGPRTLHRGPAILGLVLLILFRGLLPYARLGGGGGDAASATPAPEAASASSAARSTSGGFDAVLESHSGVILWPEAKPTITLVPPLTKLQPNPFAERSSEPLAIPFFGVYWFFRPPQKKPPENSYQTRGDPATTTFRSTDRRPLHVEAHQNLGHHIDVDCCRAVRVDIRNGDRFPGTVDMELILSDTALARERSVSLGRIPVRSTVAFPVKERREESTERLEFAMPPAAPIRRFDEFGVRFHLSGWRTRVSCRIAIERFVLVPR